MHVAQLKCDGLNKECAHQLELVSEGVVLVVSVLCLVASLAHTFSSGASDAIDQRMTKLGNGCADQAKQ